VLKVFWAIDMGPVKVFWDIDMGPVSVKSLLGYWHGASKCWKSSGILTWGR